MDPREMVSRAHASRDRLGERSRERPVGPRPARAQPRLLALQRAIGNAQVARAAGVGAPAVQRWPLDAIAEWWRGSSVYVTFGAVRSPLTPPGVAADRIPPRLGVAHPARTRVPVTVQGYVAGSGPISLSVSGPPLAGRAEIDGHHGPREIAGDTTVVVTGQEQTGQGYAGKLRLEAHHGGRRVGKSAGFSVAAFPIGVHWERPEPQARPPDLVGMLVRGGIYSDSGSVEDLDQVSVLERVEEHQSDPEFENLDFGLGGVLPANVPQQDFHAIPFGHFAGVRDASSEVKQTDSFDDARTGTRSVAVPNSGFRISHRISHRYDLSRREGKERHIITTGKRGLDTAARGFASGAGTCTPAQLQTVHDFPYLRGLGAPPR
jgi:hypothetical protein